MTRLGVQVLQNCVPLDLSNDYKSGGAYKAILNMFAEQLDDEKFAEHCRKFFKGKDENNT